MATARDLAKLYECVNGTKTINLAVKRHINRFPERFMFRLTKDEYYKILRFQSETLELEQGKYSKYLPYAFTEQGVAMLATILRTEVAEKVSIRIMDAFVAMKHYISTNLIEQKYINNLVLEDTVITRHINNVFKDNELVKNEVCAKFAHTTQHGALLDKTQTRELDYYNLDMIISVGYRVKSKNGVIFRKWANKVLKDYLLKGYAVNEKRLEYLEKTVKLIDIAGKIDTELKDSEAKEIIKVINNYSHALNMLDDYDHKRITKPNGTKNNQKITYEDCMDIIGKLKFNSDSDLFALERNEGLKSIIGTLYQSFDGNDLYPTTEEKAANFLYLITKNHTFIDGNKRIAATLFIYFLKFYNILYNDNGQVIDNNTLVALTLLIAQSNPKEKEILIDLVMNFLNN